jgi:tetratricopeptide (TPR) repeat protein
VKLALALIALVLTPALASGPAAAGTEILLELRFDGQPVDPAAAPDFSCFSETRRQWVGCLVEKRPGAGQYALSRPEPGQYRMHVSIDENAANPRRFPGDYEAQPRFEVTADGPERLAVDLPRLIHVVQPRDNGRAIDGMLTGCATHPAFETRRYAWTAEARVAFAWDPVVPGAEYRYVVSAHSCSPAGGARQLISATTSETALSFSLPPTADGEHYRFRVEAWRNGLLVGDLYTHDAGAHSWHYRFRVVDATVPRWAWVAGASAIALVLLAGSRALVGVDPARRRQRVRVLLRALLAVVVVAAGAVIAIQYAQERQRRGADAQRAVADAARLARHRDFIAAFVSAAPRPDWWDQVDTPYRVENAGDLLAAWQGHPHTEAGERQFFKAAYQGIVDHPEDEHVVATALELLHYASRDYPHRLGLARFGVDRYFQHRRRTDNCANCMPGDTTQGLVLNLSQLLDAAGRHDEAIAVCRRVIDERSADVSPYKLAETWHQIAWVYWHKGDRKRAAQVLDEALARYRTTVRGELLESTRAHFERELARPDEGR